MQNMDNISYGQVVGPGSSFSNDNSTSGMFSWTMLIFVLVFFIISLVGIGYFIYFSDEEEGDKTLSSSDETSSI
jgi:preprotein translocase subunit SecG